MIKYPKRLTGCLIKNEEELLQYAKETSNDCKYLLKCREELQQEIKNLKEQLLVAKDFILRNLETPLKEIRKGYYGEDIVLPLDEYIEVIKGEKQ